MSRAAVLTLLLAMGWSGVAGAVPLDEEACNTLEQERAGLITAGANQDMAKGADWGVANLSQERLARVQRLIEIDEQITFRCPVSGAGAKTAQPKPAPAKAAANMPPPPVPKPVLKPAVKAAAPAAKPADAKVVKPKPNDAYVPPAKPGQLP